MIFSGTTEGRKLSEMLSEDGIRHFVCVASEYGNDVMSTESLAKVHIGKMDSDEMREFLAGEKFGKGDVIVDATHPYASAVSRNIKEAAAVTYSTVYRITRGGADSADSAIRYASIEDFAHSIDATEGNILLTTGTNTLAGYCKNVSEATLARTFVRVLPAKESMEICHDLGVESSHIIAMQGPFSEGMNRAVMEEFSIRHMLTKDSGEAGGFAEKIAAARDLGVTVHMIERPYEEDGSDICEVYEKITGHSYKRHISITLAGAGMGSAGAMTDDVRNAITAADAVFSSGRILGGITAKRKFEMYDATSIASVLEKNTDIRSAVVLFSGDTGFYSGAGPAREKLCQLVPDADIQTLPGISSVSYLASKLGETYNDAVITSIHGRNTEADIKRLVSRIIRNRKTFALMSGDEDVRTVCSNLKDICPDMTVCIGQNLSYEDEKITKLSCADASKYESEGIITVLFINETPDTGYRS